ncbi:hypothetical protein QYE76_035686 [Lolium multiflorum]|uniref:RNase H type-1 domain-containing protein n=1 Tax=Lolium multiflorum TaxID=4521 RepID=A0AAD8R3F3_LOLMU|nr:hypothetical protein QYE76_035686 [Lolium multiflorum]
MTELVALKRGLELAVDNGWRDISIEGDFKGAIDAMAGDCAKASMDNGWRDISIEGDFKGAIDAMAGDCAKASSAMVQSKKNMDQYMEIAAMLSKLGKTSVSHVLREGNMVANGFAKLGHKAVTLQLWRDIPPEEILKHLEKDATELREQDHEQRCLFGASCKTAPMTPVAATESKPQDLKIDSSSSIWTAPNEGRLKLNFDGSAKGKSRARGPKAWAGARCEKRWRDISIEGDFKSAIDAIASHAVVRAKKDLEQYMEIATMLPLLGKTTVSHVLRKGNRVANGFAELGHKADMLQLACGTTFRSTRF